MNSTHCGLIYSTDAIVVTIAIIVSTQKTMQLFKLMTALSIASLIFDNASFVNVKCIQSKYSDWGM